MIAFLLDRYYILSYRALVVNNFEKLIHACIIMEIRNFFPDFTMNLKVKANINSVSAKDFKVTCCLILTYVNRRIYLQEY